MKELKIVAKVKIYAYEELNSTEKMIIDAAKEACKSAYAPYSKFQVGAAVLLEDGTIVCGNNQENGAYPSGICAERTAMFYANAQYPELTPTTLAVAAFTNNQFTKNSISPCGSCRQVLLETENRYQTPLRVLLYGENEIIAVESAKDFLPIGFRLDEQ